MASRSPSPNPNPKKSLNPRASPFDKPDSKFASLSPSTLSKVEVTLPLEPFLPHRIMSTPQPSVMPSASYPVISYQGYYFYHHHLQLTPTGTWPYPAGPTVYYSTTKQPWPANPTPFCYEQVEKETLNYNTGLQPEYPSRKGKRVEKRYIAPRLRTRRREKVDIRRDSLWVTSNRKVEDKKRDYRITVNNVVKKKDGEINAVKKRDRGSNVVEKRDGESNVVKKRDDASGSALAVSSNINRSGEEVEIHGKTSLMIRNIPNQLERHDLLRILDKHCWEENRRAEFVSDPFMSEYDFLYLPMDFRRRANYGYAFVNFTNSTGAERFSKSFHKYEWDVTVNKKICEITYAVTQGKDALKNRFKNSVFPCHTNRYLPVVLSPPRDGYIHSKPIVVGTRRVSRSPPAAAPVNSQKS